MQTALLTDTAAPVPIQPDRRAGKYLAFYIGPEEFAIRVLDVREIMGVQDITALPHLPPYVKGIINLRGKVVPVIDLRLKFDIPATEYNARTCIVVVSVPGDRGQVLMGAIVDAVSEVANITAEEIEDAPAFGEEIAVPYLTGIARTKGKVRLLLDIVRVLATSETTVPGHSTEAHDAL
jgi:purine-binding chemotaxis protein CheW